MSSTSFSPSPNAIVRSAREAEVLGEEVEPGALRDPEFGELEEVRQRLRDVSRPREELRMRTPSPSRASGSPTHTTFVGVAGRATRDVADGVDREPLEARVGLGVRGHARDVELVVDVDVRVEPSASSAAIASRASSASIGTWRSHVPSASTTAAPW